MALAELKVRPEYAWVRPDEARELLCRADLAAWTVCKRGYELAPFMWEWCDLVAAYLRLCVIAPRDHAKSETFTVDQAVWRCQYNPGIYGFVFCNTGDQAEEIKARIDDVMGEVCPELLEGARQRSADRTTFANGSRVRVGGAGKSVRGGHPDFIVGDDVLEEASCQSEKQRKRTENWWKATVGGMAHPGTWRRVQGRRVWFPPTRVYLVGTPFHQGDLLMQARHNPLWAWFRYEAEFSQAARKVATIAGRTRLTWAVETNQHRGR